MDSKIFVRLAQAVACFFLLASVPANAAVPSFLKPCVLKQVPGAAYCGKYQVFEDRAAKAGRKIDLNIILLPATDRSHAAEPVFWMEGGPGGAATDDVGAAKDDFLKALRKQHDLVFVDQRGTGASNGLACDVEDDPAHLASFFGDLFPADVIAGCRKTFETHADLRLYTTPIAVDDLDDVRAALGYGKINIAGASYGSFASQIYLRRHGDRVRAAFLLGVATPWIKQPLLFAPAAQRAVDILFRDCAADALCSKNYPNFHAEFDAVLARFTNGTMPVKMIDPATKKPVTITLARASYSEHLRRLLYSTNGGKFLPMLVHSAYRGDFLPFEELAVGINADPGFARGMYFTVTCSEGVPFITESDIVEQSRGTFVGEYRTRVHIKACEQWPRGDIPRDYIEPVKSDVPVLMISGIDDGSTPPAFATRALKSFSHGRQVLVPNYGHQLDSHCVWGMLDDFIAKGSADGLDTSCVASVRRPAFATEVPSDLRIK